MLNTNFIITLIAVLTTLFYLFQNEIKEGFINTPVVMPPEFSKISPKPFSSTDPNVIYEEPVNGLVNKSKFSYWGSNQFMPVDVRATVDPRNGKPIPPARTTLGVHPDYTGINRNDPAPMNATCRENFAQGNQGNSGVMVEASRNMQPMGPPPRFMVTGPKLNLYSPIDQARYAVDNKHSIVNYGCDDVYNSDGQKLKGKCASQTTRENYEDQEFPRDMTNSCLVGGSVSLSGQPQQPVIVDRKMWSSTKSRLQSCGVDRIRGDLPIVPDTYKVNNRDNWNFYPKPSRDLAASYITQHNRAGAENDARAAALGIQCNLMGDDFANSSGLLGSKFGSGADSPAQGAYNKCIDVTFGTDIGVESGPGVF